MEWNMAPVNTAGMVHSQVGTLTAGVTKHVLYLQKERCPLENAVSDYGWLGTGALDCGLVQVRVASSIFLSFCSLLVFL